MKTRESAMLNTILGQKAPPLPRGAAGRCTPPPLLPSPALVPGKLVGRLPAVIRSCRSPVRLTGQRRASPSFCPDLCGRLQGPHLLDIPPPQSSPGLAGGHLSVAAVVLQATPLLAQENPWQRGGGAVLTPKLLHGAQSLRALVTTTS
ncbi:hypothetical protein EYF80_013313 [Liparis tanakae]|uniref:Uncharacterized protein n=1 Tax=Liparis tanakae TaxID=230148 RepID=A0A4Z2IEN6_9TELE|nr:hypothetical protein EYF80_013313 [Liparis tanakae]